LFAMPNETVAKGTYWSLCGVTQDPERARALAHQWLDAGADRVADIETVSKLDN